MSAVRPVRGAAGNWTDRNITKTARVSANSACQPSGRCAVPQRKIAHEKERSSHTVVTQSLVL